MTRRARAGHATDRCGMHPIRGRGKTQRACTDCTLERSSAAYVRRGLEVCRAGCATYSNMKPCYGSPNVQYICNISKQPHSGRHEGGGQIQIEKLCRNLKMPLSYSNGPVIMLLMERATLH